MEVTFDPAKSKINLSKHGISLERAADFNLSTSFFYVDDSQDYGEVRYKAIGWIDAMLHTLIFTHEGGAIRAISLRKATRQEQIFYAEEF